MKSPFLKAAEFLASDQTDSIIFSCHALGRATDCVKIRSFYKKLYDINSSESFSSKIQRLRKKRICDDKLDFSPLLKEIRLLALCFAHCIWEDEHRTYQIWGLWNQKTNEVIYSRAQHDFVTDNEGNFVDGGQIGYGRRSLSDHCVPVVFESNVSYADLYNDWNYRINKYGRTIRDAIKVIPKSKHRNRNSLAFRRDAAMWSTIGPNGDQPRKMIMLSDADTDHLQAILKLNYISADTRKIINSILNKRLS